MLDLNLVRKDLEAVRTAMKNRNFPADTLDKFVELDAGRRRVIGEADSINQQRNAASKQIGALMQAGNLAEAEAKKAEVADLKDKQTALENERDQAEASMHELLAGLPNTPAHDVPVGADESANVEIRRWGEPREPAILVARSRSTAAASTSSSNSLAGSSCPTYCSACAIRSFVTRVSMCPAPSSTSLAPSTAVCSASASAACPRRPAIIQPTLSAASANGL